MFKCSYNEKNLTINFENQLYRPNFWWNIEKISTIWFIETIGNTIKKKKTFPAPDRSFDQIFSFLKKKRYFLISKWTNIPITHSNQI